MRKSGVGKMSFFHSIWFVELHPPKKQKLSSKIQDGLKVEPGPLTGITKRRGPIVLIFWLFESWIIILWNNVWFFEIMHDSSRNDWLTKLECLVKLGKITFLFKWSSLVSWRMKMTDMVSKNSCSKPFWTIKKSGQLVYDQTKLSTGWNFMHALNDCL